MQGYPKCGENFRSMHAINAGWGYIRCVKRYRLLRHSGLLWALEFTCQMCGTSFYVSGKRPRANRWDAGYDGQYPLTLPTLCL